MSDANPTKSGPATRDAFGRIEEFGRRIPFTMSTVALIALAGWLTRTASGVQLGTRALTRFGFSPADTMSFNLLRAVMSAFVTNGPLGFWTAIIATALFAGAAEWYFGSLWATIAFWGAHLATLALSWVMLVPFRIAGDVTGSILFLARDVGPSAGYVGCLGFLLAIAKVDRKFRIAALALGATVLGTVLAIELADVAREAAEVSAALSHLLALLIGFVLGTIAARRRASLGSGDR